MPGRGWRLARFALAAALSVAASRGLALDGGAPSPGAPPVAADQAPRPRPTLALDVRAACAVVDGQTDNTACIQKSVDDLCSLTRDGSGGGTLQIPPGRYAIDAATGVKVRCEGIWIEGAGGGYRDGTLGSVVVVTGQGSAPIFSFIGQNDRTRYRNYGGGLRKMAFDTEQDLDRPTQFGPLIEFRQCWGCLAENILSHGATRFAVVYAGYSNRITQFIAHGMAKTGEGILFLGDDTGCGSGGCPTRGDILQIDHGTIYAYADRKDPTRNNADCIRIRDYAATTQIHNVACNQVHVGLTVECPTSGGVGRCPSFISLWDFETEPNGQTGDGQAYGLLARDFEYLSCFGCYVSGTAMVNAVRLGSSRFAAHEAQFVGGKFSGADGSCIASGILGFAITGGTALHDCNQKGFAPGTAGFHALSLEASGKGDALSGSSVVSGLKACHYAGGTASRMGGVYLAPGTDWATVTGNLFRGCTVGVTNGSSGGHVTVSGNVGP